jgi:hypothetical protein
MSAFDAGQPNNNKPPVGTNVAPAIAIASPRIQI